MASITLNTLKPRVHRAVIRHPVSGEETPLVFHLRLPEGSIEYRSRLKEYSERGNITDEEMIQLVALTVVGWDDNGSIDEPYSEEGCLHLLSQPENLFIATQLYLHSSNRANFYELEKKSQ